MKKLVIIIALVMSPVLTFAQMSIFERFEDMDEVSSVSINQNMFKLMAKLDMSTDNPKAQEYINLVKSLKELKVISTDDSKIAKEMKGMVTSYLKSSKLEELMSVKGDGENVKFFTRKGKDENHVSELLMFVTEMNDFKVNGNEIQTVLLSLTGDIDLNKVSKLTEEMDLPGGKYLKKASKK